MERSDFLASGLAYLLALLGLGGRPLPTRKAPPPVSKPVVPIHGDDHRPRGWNGAEDPGGPDPLNWLTPSSSSGPAWAACWDNFIYGQSIDNGTEPDDVRIKFLSGVVSSNGADYFELASAADTETGGDIYTPRILQDGLYAFTLRVRWTGTDYPHYGIRYYFENAGDFTYPGELGIVFAGWQADIVRHFDSTFNTWSAIDVMTAVIPVMLTDTHWDMWPRMLLYAKPSGAGDLDGSINTKTFHVVRLGDLNSEGDWPDEGVGS